ncbi:MAG: protoporphyrinogen oxidase [Sandaracinaceae bacterium]|nr:protoporphyrinogen oxidase [Sandaracinaceae bacterium]
MSARRYLVVGAGLSGLSAAHRLRELEPSAHLELWEASARTGGWIATETLPASRLGIASEQALVVDLGPESILGPRSEAHREEHAALGLVARLGLEDRVIRTRSDRHGAYVVSRGRLARIPEGFSLIGPGDLVGFAKSDVVSLEGKARAALELAMPARPRAPSDDESLASFVRRRFGWEVLERLAQPLASGIYGADPEILGLLATMPRFLEMEAAHGSVTRALIAAARATTDEVGEGARYGLFVSFDAGMQVLTDALTDRVRDALRLERAAVRMERDASGVEVIDDAGRAERFDAVVVAQPAHRAAGLLEGIDREAAHALAAIPHGSAATVTFAWRREDVPHPLDAYGFVVPRVERRRILASTWSSEKWPDRAPAELALVRVFAAGDDDLAGRDDALLALEARRELADLMGITAPPRFTKVVRYERAMPLYGPEHVARRDAIAARLAELPDVALAGNSLFGVGIPDTIAAGERAAEKLATG